ncbi:S-layer homology domain-containing protein [Caloranaerobacter azorensis]|uniref:SH3 domain-containing protein n=1 Tax=Caloranaerobacter azorensis TaxID=116090 RepID=A0A6P1YDV3_9FIRM|nr:S-layer homology domain-containing protein [Caloranaerobacter azorensis]QIB27539.1 SH3 domain-containing protein [Caloranaerobacter azorensis]
MQNKILGLVMSILLLFTFLTDYGYAQNNRVNPPRKVLEKKIEEVAKKRGIPTVILKSIARVESVFKQYNSNGTVYTGRSGSIGVMQVHNKYGWFDTNKLKYDIDYNIEAGAEVLLMKWDMALKKLPRIGDMNPNVLENWYFVLWAYNGWSKSNNPNMIPYKYPTWTKKHTYQQLIYLVAEKEYGQKITPIDPKLLPKNGLPDKSKHYDTPQPFHYGDIEMYKKGDIVKADVKTYLRIRKEPNGVEIGRIKNGTVLNVLEGPVLKEGYFWYKVKQKDGDLQGWVVGNWIVKIGEKEEYPIKDISNSWAKDYILKLYEMGIVSGDSNKRYYPDRGITREEMAVLISKALKLKGEDYQLNYADKDKIKDWAVDYVRAVSKAGYLNGFEDNTFKPDRYITREEAAWTIAKILGEDDTAVKLEYSDLSEANPQFISAIEVAGKYGIMSGKKDGTFKPKEPLTRSGAAKIIVRLLEVLKQKSNN